MKKKLKQELTISTSLDSFMHSGDLDENGVSVLKRVSIVSKLSTIDVNMKQLELPYKKA